MMFVSDLPRLLSRVTIRTTKMFRLTCESIRVGWLAIIEMTKSRRTKSIIHMLISDHMFRRGIILMVSSKIKSNISIRRMSARQPNVFVANLFLRKTRFFLYNPTVHKKGASLFTIQYYLDISRNKVFV